MTTALLIRKHYERAGVPMLSGAVPQPAARSTGSAFPRERPHRNTRGARAYAVRPRASPEAQLRAAAIGMVVPAGYTFVDAHIWPRAAVTRSVATALRTTLGLSNLRAMLDVGRKRRRPARLSETDRSPPHVFPPETQPLAHGVEIASLGAA